MSNCRPSDLSAELNGVAFKSQFGEFSFASVPCEEMVSREELYLDLLSIVLDSADVERLILVSFNEEYGDKVMERLKGVKNKETIQFRMNEPEESIEGYNGKCWHIRDASIGNQGRRVVILTISLYIYV